jgi:lipopolysaccharide export system permease protein
MIFTAIWERYLLREILKVFFFFLFSFFFLYATLDYSLHMQEFLKDKQVQFSELFIRYAHQFIKRGTLLIPLALLVSTIKVLTSLSAHREFVALQVGGIAFKRLMRPFFIVALFCTLFNFVSTEFFLPKSLTYLDRFYDRHLKHSKGENKQYPVHSMTLKDGSKLIYQKLEKEKGAFFDVIWIRTSSEIWKMKYLSANHEFPVGEKIDRLTRDGSGYFEKKESFEKRAMKEISWEKDLPRKGFVPLENRSLSDLYQIGFQKKCNSYTRMELLTQFYYKCTIPFLSFVVVMAASPFCVRYSRKAPVFLLYSVALFGFISFFALMDAAVILGENRVASPAIAILTPFLLCTAGFTWNFARKN